MIIFIYTAMIHWNGTFQLVFFFRNFLDLKNKIKHSNNNCVEEKSVIRQLLISEKTPGFLVYLRSLVEHI